MSNISCSQMRQNMFIWMQEADSNHYAFHQSAHYHMVVRSRACGNVTMEGRASNSAQSPCLSAWRKIVASAWDAHKSVHSVGTSCWVSPPSVPTHTSVPNWTCESQGNLQQIKYIMQLCGHHLKQWIAKDPNMSAKCVITTNLTPYILPATCHAVTINLAQQYMSCSCHERNQTIHTCKVCHAVTMNTVQQQQRT